LRDSICVLLASRSDVPGFQFDVSLLYLDDDGSKQAAEVNEFELIQDFTDLNMFKQSDIDILIS
jgi:hypothetical protein